MNLVVLESILLIFCFFGIIAVIVFFKRKNRPSNHYEEVIKNLNIQKEQDLKELAIGNQKINRLEQEILVCKKKLNWHLFDK